MEYQNNQLLLNKRPDGMPDDDCWKLNTKIAVSHTHLTLPTNPEV